MNVESALTPAQRRVLADLRERDLRERSAGLRTSMSLMALAEEVAQLLFVLVVQNGAKTIVEFGTSHGYSTIHLAAAAERTRGHVYTVDALAEKTGLAAANLEAAGLMSRVTLTTADGADFVRTLPAGIDFVLVDYPIPAFEKAFPALRDRLSARAMIFVDGGPAGYWDRDDVRPFRAALEQDPEFLLMTLPMKKDQLLIVRVG